MDGQTIYLEKDVSETDRYDRLLRYVYLADGRMVNEEIVRAGLAYASPYPPDVKHQDRLAAAQRAAQTAGLGLWAGDPAFAAAPASASCNRIANLRDGPGTAYPILGQCADGQSVAVAAQTAAGDWLLLSSGAWIFASLVNGEPSSLPVVAPPAVRALDPVQVAPSAPSRQGNCHPSYPTVCIPSPPPDLVCPQIGFRRFQVTGSDPHRFDGDNDGVGCESN